MAKEQLTWQIKRRGDETWVTFTGAIDEFCDLAPLSSLSGKAVFDLAGVKGLNSKGVKTWVEFLQDLPKLTSLAFVRCSIPFVRQLAMMDEIRGSADIRSFYAPYLCHKTGEESEQLLTPQELTDPMNPPTFPSPMGKVMEFDESPAQYFAFLIRKS